MNLVSEGPWGSGLIQDAEGATEPPSQTDEAQPRNSTFGWLSKLWPPF